MQSKKAQTIVIEETCVVFFGILILVTIITVFSTLRDTTMEYAAKLQFENLARYVHNGIVQAYVNGRFTNNNFTIVLNLPSRVASYPYKIELTDKNIIVKSIEKLLIKRITIYNIDPNLTVRGNISSTASGTQTIVFDPSQNVIVLETK